MCVHNPLGSCNLCQPTPSTFLCSMGDAGGGEEGGAGEEEEEGYGAGLRVISVRRRAF